MSEKANPRDRSADIDGDAQRMDASVDDARVSFVRAVARECDLTPARTRVLELIVVGATQRSEIARDTGTSVSTVKKHLAGIFSALGPELPTRSVAGVRRFIDDLATRRARTAPPASGNRSIALGEHPAAKPRVPFATPRSIRRELIDDLIERRFRRVPAPSGRHADLVLIVGSLDVPYDGPTLRAGKAPSPQEVERMLGVPSIAALIVDGGAAALDLDGIASTIRHERPDTPTLVVEPNSSASLVEKLKLTGARVVGPHSEDMRHASQFAELAVAEAHRKRLTLDARAVGWNLTPREAEIVWLASMVSSLTRAEQLFGSAGFRTQLASLRPKVGAASYAHLALIARS